MSSGKGDDQRPSQVPDATVAEHWRRIFGTTGRKPDAEEARRIGQLELDL